MSTILKSKKDWAKIYLLKASRLLYVLLVYYVHVDRSSLLYLNANYCESIQYNVLYYFLFR